MAQYSDPNILFQSRPADVGGSLIAGLQARQQYDMNKQAMGENARLEGERKLQLLATGAANIMAAGGDPAAQSQAFDRFRAIVGRVTGHDVSGLTMDDVAPIVDRVKMVADQQGITLNGLNIEKGKLELQGARDQLQRQQDYYGGGGGGTTVSPGGLGGLAAQPSAPSVALDDARSVVASAFPNARITSWKRDANDPLTKRNPRSWHANSGGAVDVAPIPGVTFEQYVQKFRDQGYPIIEALNETGAGRSPWATGDHWHVVLGRPESAQGGPVAPVGAGGGVGAPGPANAVPAPAQSVVEAAANDPQVQRLQTAMRRAQAAGATQDANYYQSLLEARLKEIQAASPAPMTPLEDAKLREARANAAIAERNAREGSPQDRKTAVEAQDQEEKRRQRAAEAVASSENVLSTVDQAIADAQNQDFRTGAMGSLMAMAPGTGAYRLYGLIDTIKANIGFDRLQQMREASPTGGALGQVAVRELDFLQSVIANLDPGQGQDRLIENLKKVKTHYQNWQRAMMQAQGNSDVGRGTPDGSIDPYADVDAIVGLGR